MKRFIPALLVCIALAAIPSCDVKYFENTDFGDIVFDPSIALTVGEITYTVEDLFDELNDAGANIGSNDEGVVTLTYEETLQSQSASTFLSFRDQSFSNTLRSGTSLSNPGVNTTINVSETFEFDLRQSLSESFDSLFFKEGNFNFSADSDLGADIDFTATFISLVGSDEMPYVVSGTLPSGSTTFTQTQALDDFKGLFHLDDQGNPASNKFLVRIEYAINLSPTSTINANERFSFDIGVENTVFERVYGNVGNQALAVNFQVVSLDFLNDFNTGSLTFADPSIAFIFDNSFGFPLGINFQEVAAIGTAGEILPLTGDVVGTQQIVASPTLLQEGQTVNTVIELNTTNSNIDELLSSQLSKVIIEVEAESNPTSINPVYNFLNDENILDISVRVEIPLEVNISSLVAEEVVAFNNNEDLSEAKRLLFRVIAENEVPLGGLLELQFLNANGDVLFTIDERAAFIGAPVGPNGRTTEAAMSTIDILLEDADIRAIENATSINVLATLSTTDAQSNVAVKFFSDYELRFKLAVQVDVEINSGSN